MNIKAKLMSRQQKLLDKWSESSEGKRFLSKGYVMWDELPSGLITALTRVKDQETLWSDVERYLGDKASAMRYGGDIVAKELVLVAKDLMSASNMSPMGLRKAVMDKIKKIPTYAIIEATFSDGTKGNVSGNLLRLGAWLQDAEKVGTVTGYKVLEFTTDRNEAARKADEV